MIDKIISDLDSKATIIERYAEAVNLLTTTKEEAIEAALEKYLEDMKNYQVGLIRGVQEGSDEAFEELTSVKDIRNFIYHYAWHIRKYYNFSYREADVVNEIKFQIFYTIKHNYRIYDQPNEFSLLINSMRRWIKQKVGSELTENYHPKTDSYLTTINIEDDSYDWSESWVREIMNKILSEDDRQIFEMRFFKGMKYKQIGEKIGKSKDAVQRRHEKIKKQIKGYLEGIEQWQK